eukprot:365975-Chlamydomonas_euryale.AAC.7
MSCSISKPPWCGGAGGVGGVAGAFSSGTPHPSQRHVVQHQQASLIGVPERKVLADWGAKELIGELIGVPRSARCSLIGVPERKVLEWRQ